MGSPNVVLSETVQKKINHLCKVINTVEWSGCMFYSIEGTLLSPETLKIEIVDLIPLDKGTTGFTEYSFDERVMQYLITNDYFHLKIGHIHSHHNMKTFFSGTDLEEVNENSEHMNPYLSLIVNNAGDFSCKLAFRVKSLHTPSYELQDINNNKITFTKKEATEFVANYDCRVTSAVSLDDSFLNQITEISKKRDVINEQKAIATLAPHFSKTTPLHDFNFKNDLELSNPFTFEEDNEVTLESEEGFYCYVLRLGQAINGDTMEEVMEDIEESIKVDGFSFEEVSNIIKKNFRKFIKDFYNMKVVDKEEFNYLWEGLLDEIQFSEFEFVDDFLEHLNMKENGNNRKK